MPVDKTWFEKLWKSGNIGSVDTVEVEGVTVEMPVPGRTRKRHLQWQRRVLDDVLPDSPNADASERIPLQIIRQLTSPEKPTKRYGEVLGDDSEYAPLAPIFLFTPKGRQTRVPVAFHALSTKAADQTVKSRAFTEQTFLLLMRDATGALDEALLESFVDRFRAPPESLDLAHRKVLDLLHPGWSRSLHTFNLPNRDVVKPFVPAAGELIRRDIRTVIAADLPSADFFKYTNQLLALHLGLYQPRIAVHLNPAMDCLLAELAEPGSVDIGSVEAIEQGKDPRHEFTGRFTARAPSGGARPVLADSRERRDYQAMEDQLAELHFNLMLLHRVRELTRSYLAAQGFDSAAAEQLSARLSQVILRMQDDPDFRRYLHRASEALAVRFAFDQISDASRTKLMDDCIELPSGLHALRGMYIKYNLDNARNVANSRAYKQGAQVTRSLLIQGETGLVQTRRNVGPYFEIGAGILPLLLLLIVGSEREKITVSAFWDGLARYGLRLDEDERGRLLSRLKAMGLYERFSDAGEASYVRGLITSKLKEAHR
jgi:hypothetical protein